jgi:DNA repair protein RadD
MRQLTHMITITQRNSLCQVETNDPKIDKLLKQELSYQDQGVSFSLTKNIKEIKAINQMLDSKSQFSFDRSGMEKRLSQLLHINRQLNKDLVISLYHNGTFPTGLLPRVQHILSEEGHEVNIKDLRIKPKTKEHKFVLKEVFPALRYYQKEATKEIDASGRGIVVFPTGTGKTVTIARMIWDLGLNTLIITPGKSITDMMMEVMLRHFGKGKVEKLTSKTKQIKKPIAIVNIQALIKMNPAVLKDIDVVFVDEFHHSSADTYREVNIKHLANCYHRIGFTATNFRNDGSDLALESVLSNVLYDYPIRQAINDGFLMQPEFEIIDNESWDDSTYQKTYKAAIVENEDRNGIIAQLAQEHSEDQVLILVQQIEHGESIKALIPGSVFIHGEEKDIIRQRALEDFKKGKIKCLIGSAVVGEGVDLPNANVLILAGGGKARSAVMQSLGRVLRICKGKLFAKIYDFADHGSEWLHDHAMQRQDVYRIYLPD